MADTITIPKIGTVKKSQAIAVAGVGAGVVLYAFWRSRSSADNGEEVAVEPEDAYLGLTDGGGFGGAVGGYDSSASGNGSDTATTDPRTNAEWSQLAEDKLIGSYETAQINGALGRYLGRQPLTTLDQEIVRAAIARAGYPPVGGPYAVISGGDTAVMVAPTGVTAKQSTDGVTIAVAWQAVPGAASYHVFRSDQGGPTVASGTSMTLYHIDPGYTVKISVAAVSASGKVGPKSSQVDVKTVGAKVTAPTGVTATAATKNRITVRWKAVAGAQGYNVYRNDLASPGLAGTTTSTALNIDGLTPGKSYRFQVAARTGAGAAVGPRSAAVSATTKKK